MALKNISSTVVSDACQIKDLDHIHAVSETQIFVSDACQIKDLDHSSQTCAAR